MRRVLGLVLVLGLQWALLLYPAPLLRTLPALWNVPSVNIAIPPQLLSRVESFGLGFQSGQFLALGCSHPVQSQQQIVQDQCKNILATAAKSVGFTRPLTSEELLGLRDMLSSMDAHNSVADRVMGLFNFVNLVWVVAAVGITATVGPFLAYVLGDRLKRYAFMVYAFVVVPMHKYGVLELAAYAVLGLVSAQAYRYPPQLSTAAVMVGLLGGLGLLPCWIYTIVLFPLPPEHRKDFPSLTGWLMAYHLVPLALGLESQLIGFTAIAMVYIGLGFVMGALLELGFFAGFSSKHALHRCMASSMLLVSTFATLRVIGLPPLYVQPFSAGVMTLGNTMYFLCLLIMCMKPKQSGMPECDAVMALSLLFSMFVGNVFAMPAAVNVACTFFVLWVMQKQTMVNWGPAKVAVLFVNFALLFFLAHYLRSRPHLILSIFDAKGMYL